MMFLLVQQWDIINGKDSEYTDFILRRHLPVMHKLGLNMIGAFHTIIGSGPRISAVSLAPDLLNIQKAIETEDFFNVTNELHAFVTNYSNAVLRDTGRVNTEGYGINAGAYRFNQYFELIPGTDAEYIKFLQNQYIPVLTKSGIRINAEWQVILGSSIRILLEGVTTSIINLGNLLMSSEFRVLKYQLLHNYSKRYSSRLLMTTGRIELTNLLAEMTKAL